jgi:uncharacterized OB-fold protein
MMQDTEFSELAPYRGYTDALARGALAYQHCRQCERAVFQPRVNCPHCGATQLQWRDSAGHGSVYAISEVIQKEGNYNVALIDLDEGFRMMSTLIGVASAPIGQRVRARVEPANPATGDARVVFDVLAAPAMPEVLP